MIPDEQDRIARQSHLGRLPVDPRLAKGAKFFGVAIDDMSRDELITIISWYMQQDLDREARQSERAEHLAARYRRMAGII